MFETHQLQMILLLVTMFLFFLMGKPRYDVCAFAGLIAGVLGGLVPMQKAFEGFSHPATVTVMCVLILNQSLSKGGLSDYLARFLSNYTKNFYAHMGILLGAAMLLSGFMNNVAALALLMPVTLATCYKEKRSASLFLMPLSFASILGGLSTLIGTPPNIIISSFRQEIKEEPFAMFDFTPVGLSVATVGTLFLVFVGWRFLSKKVQKKTFSDLSDIEPYLAEALVGEHSRACHKTVQEIEDIAKDSQVYIAAVLRKGQSSSYVTTTGLIESGDILILEAEPKEMHHFIDHLKLSLVGLEEEKKRFFHQGDHQLIEVVVVPGSPLESQRVSQIHFRRRHGLSLLGLSRQGRTSRGRLWDFQFKTGDVILVHGLKEQIDTAMNVLGLLPLENRGLHFASKPALYKALTCFLLAIFVSAFGLLSPSVSFALAVLAMILLGVMRPDEAYHSIEGPIIMLLGSMIPIAQAFQSTGTAQKIVETLISHVHHAPPWMILGFLMMLTMALTDILNNAATALIAAPIAAGIAQKLDVSVDGFLMGVCIAASSAFLTPVGHQNNALILGPGGYRFSDFWRMGLPLEIIVLGVSLPLLKLFWRL